MAPEEYKWHVELVRSRYHALQLTFQQAEAVLQFEEDKDYSSADDFSTWEELDFAFDTFQQILTPKQFRRYQAQHADEVQSLQRQLEQFDAAAADNIPQLQRQLAFYRDELIPALYREPLLFPFGALNEPTKEAFVVAEYQRFLRSEKKRILIQHYRQHRQFGPHILQQQLLHLQLRALIPDYAAFIEATDAPTRAVVQFLCGELRSHTGHLYEDVLRRHEATMVAHSQEEFGAQHGQPPEQLQGYVSRPEYNREAHLDQWILTLLWLGRNPDAHR